MHKLKRHFLLTLIYISAMVALGLIAWSCFNLLSFPPVDLSVFRKTPQARFFPEPEERTSYITSLLVLPLLIWFVFFYFKRLLKRLPETANTFRIYKVFLATSWATAFMATLLILWNNPNEFFGNSAYPYHSFFFFPATWLASIGILYAILKKDFLFSRGSDLKPGLLKICIALSVIIVSYTIFDEHSHILYKKQSDLAALIGPVTQAVQGGTLWVDIRSQYGLYPHFLEPWFRVVGLNLLNFTLTIAFLTLLADIFFALVLFKWVRHPYLAFAGFLFYQVITKFPYAGLVMRPLYMPYFPLRIFFPCLFLFLMFRYLAEPGVGKRMGLWLTATIAVLWNLDSGSVVFLTTMIVLIYREAVLAKKIIPPLKESTIHIVQGTLFLALGFFAYFVFAFMRTGQWPDPEEIFYFQRMYYLSGFYMHPMNMFGAWCIPVSIYIFTLIFCMRYLHAGIRMQRNIRLFTLSILGLGLFSYFQGRSYSFGMMFLTYPAVLLFLVFLENHLPALRLALARRKTTTHFSTSHILAKALPAGLGLLVIIHTMVFHFENLGYQALKNRSNPIELLPIVSHTSLGGNSVREPYQEIQKIRNALPKNANVFIFSPWNFYFSMALEMRTQIPMDMGNNYNLTIESFNELIEPVRTAQADYVLFSPRSKLNRYPFYSEQELREIQSLIEKNYHLEWSSDWVWVYKKN